MTTAPYPQVTNELLSAYIDEAVTEEERRLVEQAVAEDADVAWRLESLRTTVRLLRELPVLSLPRSFVLTPEQVGQTAPAAEPVAAAAAAKSLAPPRRQRTDKGSGFWHDLRRGWGHFWQGGSPVMRNAMAASFAVLLALLIAPRFLANTSFVSLGTVQTAATQPQSQAVAQAPAAKQLGAAGIPVPTQIAPTAAGEVTGPAIAAAQPAQSEEAAVAKVAPPQPQAASAAQPEVETAAQPAAQPAAPSAAPAGDANVQGGTTAGALAASGQPAGVPGAGPGAQAGPSMGSPSGSAAMDAAQAASSSTAPAPAAGPRVANDTGTGTGSGSAPGAAQVAAPPAPISAASADLASAYAVTDEPETIGAAVAGAAVAREGTEPLAAADTQKIQTTPVATVAAPTQTPAPTSMPLQAAAAPAVATPAVVAAAGSGSASPAVQSRAAEQASNTQRGIPAWAGLTIQAAAILAALATLMFAILWWRSRRPAPPA